MPSVIAEELFDIEEAWRAAMFEAPPALSRALTRVHDREQDEDDFSMAFVWGLVTRRELQAMQNAAARTVPGWMPSHEMRVQEAFVGDVLFRAEMGSNRQN